MQVEVQGFRDRSIRGGEGGHETEHGDHGWKRVARIWCGKGDMKDLGGVDDFVDGFTVIFAWLHIELQ